MYWALITHKESIVLENVGNTKLVETWLSWCGVKLVGPGIRLLKIQALPPDRCYTWAGCLTSVPHFPLLKMVGIVITTLHTCL